MQRVHRIRFCDFRINLSLELMPQLFFLCTAAWGCPNAVSLENERTWKARCEREGEQERGVQRALIGEGEIEAAANGKDKHRMK